MSTNGKRSDQTRLSNEIIDDSIEIGSDQDEAKSPTAASPAGSGISKNSQTAEDQKDTALKRSRKSYQWIKRTINKELWNLKPADRNKLWNEDNHKFSLKISNFPVHWDVSQIKDVILNDFGPVDYVYMSADEGMCFLGMVKLEFVSFTDCQRAWEVFHGKTIEEIKLFAEIRDLDEESDDENASPTKRTCNRGPWRPDVDVWEIDPRGLYGFHQEYLLSLGIQPPLQNWVQVTNIRCDKSELKEVMELAGQVLMCVVDTRTIKIGHVMYSHPLEAVQAVSMLNNQTFYGQPLKITTEECPDTKTLLPKGLLGVGPGLGADGCPLRDIVKQYERFVQYKSTYVNPNLFLSPDVLFPNNETRDNSNNENVYPAANPVKYNRTLSCNIRVKNFGHAQNFAGHMDSNMDGSWATSGPKQIVSSNPMSGPMCGPVSGPMPGPMSGPMPGPMSGQMNCPVRISGPGMPAPMFGPRPQNAHQPMSMNAPRPIGPLPDNHVTVELFNLPLSTTFTLLCEKMAECGQVMSLQLTSPGCAVVQFAKRIHAEKCFQQYNNRIILGNRIGVKFL